MIDRLSYILHKKHGQSVDQLQGWSQKKVGRSVDQSLMVGHSPTTSYMVGRRSSVVGRQSR